MTHRRPTVSLLLALPLLTLVAEARGQEVEELQVTAPGAAGQAWIRQVGCEADGGALVQVRLRVVPQAKDAAGEEQRLEGQGRLARDGSLTWTYERRLVEDVGLREGLSAWLSRPRFSVEPFRDRVVVKRETARLEARGRALVGVVAGQAQTWTRVPPLGKVVVLVVPGLSTNNWNRAGIPYLDENQRALAARGLRARRLAVSTEQSVAENARFIAREIRLEAAAGRRVIVLAHSKGATDTTAALALNADLHPHVLGVVAIQPVYGGSPIADIVAKSPTLSAGVRVVFERAFDGSRRAVLDLARAARQEFVAAHPYPAARIPTVVVRSSFDRRVSKSVLWANQKLIARLEGAASDGMVTPADQTIPGAARTIDLADLDHFEPGVRVESPHTPTDVTNRALDALLELVAPR